MMSQNSNSYLEAQVHTATPQKLQLILIEAAIRFAKKAQVHREQGDEAATCEAIGRAHRIVTEIIAGLRPDVDQELVGKVAPIYVFVARSLSDASLPENNQLLADAIRILEEERTTWKMVCEQMTTENGGQHNDAAILDQRCEEKKIVNADIDSFAIHATAGDANPPAGNPMTAPMATYAPSPFFSAGVSRGVSGPSTLSGPKKTPSETVSEPDSGGFSIDA
ncbi:MAG: flagellar protein FliS [Planctomycetia bacterium]|jgi:flagellar protein FliS